LGEREDFEKKESQKKERRKGALKSLEGSTYGPLGNQYMRFLWKGRGAYVGDTRKFNFTRRRIAGKKPY